MAASRVGGRALRSQLVRPGLAEGPALRASSAGSATGSTAIVTDPGDTRAAIYRTKVRRNHSDYQRQVRALADRALRAAGLPWPGVGRQVPLNRLGCQVGVHYSWDCLRRLRSAREAGREVEVESVLLPCGVEDSLVQLAGSVSPSVYFADPALIAEEFSQEGTDQTATCNYVVAFPVTVPIPRLRPPIVVLDGIGSAQNVGQILRTAFHLGVTSVVASRGAWGNLSGRACRVSMGWLYYMDFHQADRLEDALLEMRSLGIRIYAAEERFSTRVAPHEPRGSRNWALVLGHEDLGVSERAIELADARICVPQQQGESLNVAHAAAICLYELARECGREPARGS